MQNKKNLLILFFSVIILKQLNWVSLVPLWHTPDEQAHFAQVQNIAEKNIIKTEGPTTSREIEISEKLLNVKRTVRGDNNFTYHPNFRINYTNNLVGEHEERINRIDKSERKNLSIKEASGYPPLYYQFSAIAYRLVYSSGLIDRVFIIRIFQNLLYVLTVFVYWLLAKEIFKGKDVFLFLLLISFLPMPSFVGAGVTSDNLMNMLFTVGIYIGLLIVKYGLKTKFFLASGALVLLGVMAKPHFLIILPIFWFAILLSCFKTKTYRKFLMLNFFCIISVPFLFWIFYPTYLQDFLATGNIFLLLPEIGSLSGVFAGKELSIASYLTVSLQKTYRETIPWFWGIFRWLSFTLDRWYYRFWNLVAVISIVFFVLKLRKKIKIEVIYFISSVLIYFFMLFVWDYLFFLGHGFSFGIQGRYYFPVLFSIIFIIFYYFPFKKILAIFSVVFNFYALLKIAASYYSMNSLGEFINQASQYKPWFFKGNFLIILMFAYVIILLIFLVKSISKMSSPREARGSIY